MTRSEAFHIREAFNRLNAIVVDLLKNEPVEQCSICQKRFLRRSLGKMFNTYQCAECWNGFPSRVWTGNHHSSKDYDSHGIDKAVSYKLDHPEEYLT